MSRRRQSRPAPPPSHKPAPPPPPPAGQLRARSRERHGRGRDVRRRHEERGDAAPQREQRVSTAQMLAGLREFQRRVTACARREGRIGGAGVAPRKMPRVVAEMHRAAEGAMSEYIDGRELTQVYAGYQRLCGGTAGGDPYRFPWPRGDVEFLDLADRRMRPQGIPVEIADAILRAFEWFGEVDLDAASVLFAKHLYNDTAPERRA